MSASSDWQIKPKKFTPKQKLTAESERAVKHFLQTVTKDKLLLLAIVTGGKAHFHGIAAKAFKGFLVNDQMVDQMFQWMTERAGDEPKKQYDELQRSGLVALKLEKLQGLARFITSEQHLDQVLDKWISDPDEKRALRSQLLIFWKTQQVMQ